MTLQVGSLEIQVITAYYSITVILVTFSDFVTYLD